jgi:serine/threonine protein kinase
VYVAKDTKLKREVALKVLPEAFTRDSERMARFQSEAEVLAALNHPNFAQIYGVEERAFPTFKKSEDQLQAQLRGARGATPHLGVSILHVRCGEGGTELSSSCWVIMLP